MSQKKKGGSAGKQPAPDTYWKESDDSAPAASDTPPPKADGKPKAKVPAVVSENSARQTAAVPAAVKPAPVLTKPDPVPVGPVTQPSSSAPLVVGPGTNWRVIQRVDPWSVTKLGFLLSIGLGIMTVIAAALSWMMLDSFHVFSAISQIVGEVDTSSGEFNKLMSYLHFDKVISIATIIAIINTILLTLLMTISAFLYNVVASLVGGIHIALVEEE